MAVENKEVVSPLKVGDTVRIKSRGRMTVRAVSIDHDRGRVKVRIDDGDPADADLKTNGWSYTCWELAAGLEAIK